MAHRNDPEQAIYIISVAAELAGVHPQTLRVYERKGLLRPQRTEGNTRRYSERDIELLRRIQDLTNEGVNLAGVTRILELERKLERLEARNERLVRELEETLAQLTELLDAPNHTALVPLKDVRRVRRALKSEVVERAAARRTFAVPPVS
ncbi:MAG TPA: helix-turn-helix transcriptional regulator [Actinomycetota bacterium]|jgi:MerR family transcriptional regulator, heat shock protein HspR|nr:helix-turn-helix transcriptional regulator [Actinomycetota bacterium]